MDLTNSTQTHNFCADHPVVIIFGKSAALCSSLGSQEE